MIKITKQKLIYSLKHYLLNLIIIWTAISFYRFSRYYSKFLRPETQTTLLYFALGYSLFGLFFYILIPLEKIPKSKGEIVFRGLKKIVTGTAKYIQNFTKQIKYPLPKLEKHEKTSFLFIIIKIFFLPIMLNFFFANFASIKFQLRGLANLSLNGIFSVNFFNTIIYPLLLAGIFLLDTLWFSFGYTFEAGFLKNKIRSVEPTILGWAVALICYPPFNTMFTKYASWYANDYAVFPTNTLTFIARVLILSFLFIYLLATFALGAKCSNLTNRGIVSRGVYKYIRHPAYISKNLAWWITIIPVFSITAFFSMFVWSGIYFLRAITEERHLIRDPNYQDYVKKVKYRFIPGVY